MNSSNRLFSSRSALAAILLGIVICLLPLARAASVEPGSEPDSRHPFLFFSAADIPEIRARMELPAFADRRALLFSYVDKLLGEPPSDIVRVNHGNCVLLAFAYIVSGDPRYAERAIAEALASAAVPEWGSGFHFNRGADLRTSERSLGLAVVYDWCHDRLSAGVRATIREALITKGLEPYFSSIDPALKPNWWVHDSVNNWRGVCHGGNSVAALVLYHESELARTCAEMSNRHVMSALREHILIDSGGHEGVEYNNYGVEYALIGAAALQRFFGGYEELFRELADTRLGNYWSIYMCAPDRRFANIGRMNYIWSEGVYGIDGDPAGGPSSMRSALFDALVPGGDRLLRWASDNGGQRFYWEGANPFQLLWRRADAPSLLHAPMPELQEAVLFRGAGHAILQSDRLWLAYSGGAAFNRGDVGAFVLVSKANEDWERLIWIDPPIQKENFGSGRQSTYLIGGAEQVTGESTLENRGRYLRFGSAQGFHYLANDIRALYADPALTRLVRHMVMVRGTYIVLLDDIAASKPLDLEARFQTAVSKEIELRDTGAKIAGAQRDLHLVFSGSVPITLGEGSGGALRHVSASANAERATLVSVLFPTAKDGDAPEVETAGGVVTITHDGERDLIVFVDDTAGWRLHEVNGVSADEIPTGSERTVHTMREGRSDADEVPPWILRSGSRR
ncbi:MAG TPA: hypothetical protein VMM36_11900 [Opitutaceae bacterium]|nr:hypothetical protein [Opitutaceae bacterium]